MKVKLSTLFIVFLVITKSTLAQPINVSGNWVLNVEKSSFGQVPTFVVFQKTTLTQNKDSIYLRSESVDQDGKPIAPVTIKYPLNGNPTERIYQDTIKLTGSFTWSDDKKTLMKNQNYSSVNEPQKPFKIIKETWHLSDDGKELIIERALESLTGREVSYSIKAVFDKQ
jgi:hypothetical protein